MPRLAVVLLQKPEFSEQQEKKAEQKVNLCSSKLELNSEMPLKCKL